MTKAIRMKMYFNIRPRWSEIVSSIKYFTEYTIHTIHYTKRIMD